MQKIMGLVCFVVVLVVYKNTFKLFKSLVIFQM